MKKQIFPKEILESTHEVHQFSYGKKSTIIYTTLLLLVVGALISLPLIKVDVYTAARGIIKSEQDRIALIPAQSGKVIFSNLKNNLNLTQGDTLLIIENPIGEEKIKLVSKQIKEHQSFIADLNALLLIPPQSKKFKTTRFLSDYNLFNQGLNERKLKHDKAQKDFNRDSVLYSKGVISASVFEKTTLAYDLSINNLKRWKRQYRNQWEVSLAESNKALTELQSTKKQLQQGSLQHIITAPLSGTFLSDKGIFENNFINAGQAIGEISPSGNLIVECYASPADIGYLAKGTKAKFQIDAFNYNQWGMLTGKITEIGNDIALINNNPSFKIRCQMDKKTLSLKNGFKGNLKKGMTLNARFLLSQRSLFDLLYDSLDDWLNPSKKQS